MRKVILSLFIMLALSSFAFAASSEVAADFIVNVPDEEIQEYVPAKSVTGNYLGYIILIFIVLAFFYFASKKRVPARNSASSRKRAKTSSLSGKKKKISKAKK